MVVLGVQLISARYMSDRASVAVHGVCTGVLTSTANTPKKCLSKHPVRLCRGIDWSFPSQNNYNH